MDIKVYLVQKYFDDLENTSCKLQPKKKCLTFLVLIENHIVYYIYYKEHKKQNVKSTEDC